MKNLKKLGNVIPYPFQLDLKMKLTIYLFIASFFQIQAGNFAENDEITFLANVKQRIVIAY